MNELAPGGQFGPYRILSVIGYGGMGVVYLADDAHLDRRVALKVLAPQYTSDAAFRTRFERESRLAASLDHPNVVPVYDAGEVNGVLFIAMRYVAGADLRVVIDRDGPFPVARALGISAQLASALDAAHGLGLIHRDVKPGNVLLATGHGADGSEHVYLTDFGLTKRSASKSGLTQLGQLVGTIDYIAPEQIGGTAIDGRADIYALGCVFYEMLAGTAPFARESDLATMAAHLHEPPPRLTSVRPDLPPAADELMAKVLAKNPDERYSSAADFVRAARVALAPDAQHTDTAAAAAAAAGAATVLTAAPPPPPPPTGPPAPTVFTPPPPDVGYPGGPPPTVLAPRPAPPPGIPPPSGPPPAYGGTYPPPAPPGGPNLASSSGGDDLRRARRSAIYLVIIGVLALLGGGIVFLILSHLPADIVLQLGIVAAFNLVLGPLCLIVAFFLRRGERWTRLPALGLGAITAVLAAADIIVGLTSGQIPGSAFALARLALGIGILLDVSKIRTWASPTKPGIAGGRPVVAALVGLLSLAILAGTAIGISGATNHASPTPPSIGQPPGSARPSSNSSSPPTAGPTTAHTAAPTATLTPTRTSTQPAHDYQDLTAILSSPSRCNETSVSGSYWDPDPDTGALCGTKTCLDGTDDNLDRCIYGFVYLFGKSTDMYHAFHAIVTNVASYLCQSPTNDFSNSKWSWDGVSEQGEVACYTNVDQAPSLIYSYAKYSVIGFRIGGKETTIADVTDAFHDTADVVH